MMKMNMNMQLGGVSSLSCSVDLVSDHLTPLDPHIWNGFFVAVSSVGGYEGHRVRCADGLLVGI